MSEPLKMDAVEPKAGYADLVAQAQELRAQEAKEFDEKLKALCQHYGFELVVVPAQVGFRPIR